MLVLRTPVLAAAVLLAGACLAPLELSPSGRPEPIQHAASAPAASAESGIGEKPLIGEEIVVCGRRFFVGAPVVLWTQAPGYDASNPHARFGPDREGQDAPEGLRYQPGRKERGDEGRVLVEPGSDDLECLREVVDQMVLHYDTTGTSRECFRVLQDVRGLSVHFLLDLDGTIYQTLDLRDQAWHATKANPRSIGVEIANLGAYPPGTAKPLDEWYRTDAAGPWLAVPEGFAGGGVRTPGFVARPVRSDRIRGVAQGVELEQFDFTAEQYDSLAKLAAALCAVFPRIEPDAPRDAQGRIPSSALSDAEFDRFHGILGHLHVQANKQDPGPAFDWDGFLAAVRMHLAQTAQVP